MPSGDGTADGDPDLGGAPDGGALEATALDDRQPTVAGICQPVPVVSGGEERAGVSAAAAVSMLSEALGTVFVVVGPLAGGETGATEVRGGGHRHVLKWELDPENQARRREGVVLAERLRTGAGWPCPVQQVIEAGDCLLVLQELMDGQTVAHLSRGLVGSLLELHDRRLQLTVDDVPNRWAADMIEVLVEGGNGYCLHQPLREFDARTRRVVERIEEIGRSLSLGDLSGSHVVHGDLHPGNVLQAEGRLTAVVDMDYARLGDADFDLTMLALSSLGVGVDRGVRGLLFDRGVDALPDPKRRAYVGSLLLRFLDWPIRRGRTAEVEFWLAEADRLLPDA